MTNSGEAAVESGAKSKDQGESVTEGADDKEGQRRDNTQSEGNESAESMTTTDRGTKAELKSAEKKNKTGNRRASYTEPKPATPSEIPRLMKKNSGERSANQSPANAQRI